MRERLIELLKNAPRNTRMFYDQYADYLLTNGVIVPPCKVGDVVYWYHKKANKIKQSVVEEIQIFFSKDEEDEEDEEDENPTIYVYNFPDDMGIKKLGDNAFLAREEAEAALRKEGAE